MSDRSRLFQISAYIQVMCLQVAELLMERCWSSRLSGSGKRDRIDECVAHIAKWTQSVEREQFILRLAGSEEQYDVFLEAVAEYSGTVQQVIDEGSKQAEEQHDRLLFRIAVVERLLGGILSEIDHKHYLISENPFPRRE